MRIIPVVLLKEGHVVQSYGFNDHPIIGRPGATFSRLLDYQADEVIVLDISENAASSAHPDKRRDLSPSLGNGRQLLDILGEHQEKLLFPVSAGGGIRQVADAVALVTEAGVDKVVLNEVLKRSPNLVAEFAKELGSQALVASVDVIETPQGPIQYDYKTQRTIGTPQTLETLFASLTDLGFGELFLNSVSRDGRRCGYSLSLIELASEYCSLPTIVCGGLGKPFHAEQAINLGKLSAVAAANYFHSHEMSYPLLKKKISAGEGVVRTFSREQVFIRRDSDHVAEQNLERVSQRLGLVRRIAQDYGKFFSGNSVSFRRCSNCLYPDNSATSLSFGSGYVCSGCLRHTEAHAEGTGKIGLNTLRDSLSARLRGYKGEFDCVVAVSGGKDSYFQTHFIKEELGLRPLLVTYDANNWTELGLENLHSMKDRFNVEHVIVKPPEELLSKMNLLGFLILGDMSWHAHVGITSTPMRIASEMGIPFVFYGEHGREDMSGQFRFGDFPEITFRERFEHDARGYDWPVFEGLFGITSEDLTFWSYPSDSTLFDSELRGLHVGSFINWNPHEQTALVSHKYGFRTADFAFDRTYRRGSNLDDMHENGLHDWLKYIKFGYGRATDHASKDIRLGVRSRSSMLEVARTLDSTLPSDIERWLPYAGISRATFFAVANSFRSQSVWKFSEGRWVHPEGMEDTWGTQMSPEIDSEIQSLEERIRVN